MPKPTGTNDGAAAGAERILASFHAFLDAFNRISARARRRFETRNWRAGQADALERLKIYPSSVAAAIDDLRSLDGTEVDDRAAWARMKQAYSVAIAAERNAELAQTYFNSVSRNVFSTVGVDPHIEYPATEIVSRASDSSRVAPGGRDDGGIVRRYDPARPLRDVLIEILGDHRFGVDYRDVERDAALAAAQAGEQLRAHGVDGPLTSIEVLAPVFFRNKGAYVIGRIESGGRTFPLVLPLVNLDGGIAVDAVLIDESEVSILFSFTRSYFHVEAARPAEVIAFLRSILPLKPVAELYIALGLNKHGKTELYRDLRRRLERSGDRFEIAAGDRGMVMLVFTLPDHDRVFKVIRDRFEYPKQTTAREVRERYRLVFERDRVGRLVEAQEFEHLKIGRDRFTGDLLDELLAEAAHSVKLEGGEVILQHLYTERKVWPLNLHVRECDDGEAERAILDYGYAIRELAAANIFPGDFLLKNFGVTRHGRVVFYDYDELCLLTDCSFRSLPPARTPEDELASEPWFTVGDNDIFPEEFRTFLDLRQPLLEAFERHHGELFTVGFWRGMQERHQRGEIVDFYPYPQSRRIA